MAEEETKEPTGHTEMSFLDHLDHLRMHILRSLVAIVVVGVVAFLNKDFIFDTVIFGPRSPQFPTYRFMCWLSESLCMQPPDFQILTRDLGEQFMIHLKSSFWIGFLGAFPYVFYEFWRFIRPGLYPQEQKAARGMVLICSMLFTTGVLFGYYFIAPFAITFLGSYNVGNVATTPSLESYVDYLTMLTLPVGLVFELPVVAWFLSKIGILYPSFLRTYRRHALVVIVIVAAIITPPDVTSQVILSLPLLALYEVSILISARVARQREEEWEEGGEESKS
ncbi:MAG: twin-arginine translocase subunit TatC [Saprospiraceae bacterium]|nr:twin-arginine translocase subunit TatC [Saprospiraceae bacterium]